MLCWIGGDGARRTLLARRQLPLAAPSLLPRSDTSRTRQAQPRGNGISANTHTTSGPGRGGVPAVQHAVSTPAGAHRTTIAASHCRPAAHASHVPLRVRWWHDHERCYWRHRWCHRWLGARPAGVTQQASAGRDKQMEPCGLWTARAAPRRRCWPSLPPARPWGGHYESCFVGSRRFHRGARQQASCTDGGSEASWRAVVQRRSKL